VARPVAGVGLEGDQETGQIPAGGPFFEQLGRVGGARRSRADEVELEGLDQLLTDIRRGHGAARVTCSARARRFVSEPQRVRSPFSNLCNWTKMPPPRIGRCRPASFQPSSASTV